MNTATTLHTINKTSAQTSALQDCLAAISDGDALLLIENGVYAAMPAQALTFTRLPGSVQCYVLSEDCVARGIDQQLSPEFQVIDYDDFVALSCRHSKVVSWF